METMPTPAAIAAEFDALLLGMEPLVEVDDGTPDADCTAHWECRL